MPNMVRTSKYEYYNFLPKFLWEEFNPAAKIANVYFLFIAVLQVSALRVRRTIFIVTSSSTENRLLS